MLYVYIHIHIHIYVYITYEFQAELLVGARWVPAYKYTIYLVCMYV